MLDPVTLTWKARLRALIRACLTRKGMIFVEAASKMIIFP